MPRLQSLFKSSSASSASSQASSSSSSRRSSTSTTGNAPPVSYVQFVGLTPGTTQKQAPTHSVGTSSSNATGYAEMLDDENMAWGKPKKASRRT